MVDAGRILIMPKGVWSNLTSYEMLDLVTQDGIAYLARQANVGQSPKLDSTYQYWQPFGSAEVPDSETIIINGSNELAVNIDNRSLKYDSTNDYLKVSIDGITIKYDSTNGYLYADVASSLNDLTDVTIASAVNGQVLTYDSVTGKWKNATLDFGKKLSATLSAGSTTLTFTDSTIGNNSLIDIYTDPYGIVPLTATQSGTTVTLTFEAQSAAVTVDIIVKNM